MSKFLFSLLAIISINVAHAEIYKWKDSAGSTNYSDMAPKVNSGAKVNVVGKAIPPSQTEIQQKEVKPTEEAGQNSSSKIEQENAAIRERNRVAEEEYKRREIELNKKNCENAKTNLSRFSAGGRIRMIDEKGEAYYLNEDDIKKNIESSSEDVKRYCK